MVRGGIFVNYRGNPDLFAEWGLIDGHEAQRPFNPEESRARPGLVQALSGLWAVAILRPCAQCATFR